MSDIWEDLKSQSLSRALSLEEVAFAANLESIYAQNIHDFAEVCQKLNAIEGVSSYTPAVLQEKLAAINASLDKAYETHGRGAV